jgi:hypothetical protein
MTKGAQFQATFLPLTPSDEDLWPGSVNPAPRKKGLLSAEFSAHFQNEVTEGIIQFFRLISYIRFLTPVFSC